MVLGLAPQADGQYPRRNFVNNPALHVRQLWQRVEGLVGDDAIAVLLEIVQVSRDELGDLEAAEAALRKALEYEPAHAGVLAQLEALLEDRGDWSRLLAVLDRRAELSDDPDTRRALYERGARICEDALGDEAQAAALRERGSRV